MLEQNLDNKNHSFERCFGNKPNQQLYARYHDYEWGVPVYNDDRHLFEMLILEGAQAGLSWETVLKKRESYKEIFHNFEVKKVATMTDEELNEICKNPNIIRNKLKIFSARRNAIAFIKIQKEYGSFSNFIWKFVENKPIINYPKVFKDIPVSTKISEKISKSLKKYGMNFVGPTIIYAFMQAVGMVDDHLVDCCCAYKKNENKNSNFL